MTIVTSHTLRSSQFIREIVSALNVREELFSLCSWKSTMGGEDFFLKVKETLTFFLELGWEILTCGSDGVRNIRLA